MTTLNSASICSTETDNRFSVVYGPSERINPALLFAVAIAALCIADHYLYTTRPRLFSSDWLAIPICCFVNSAFLFFLYRNRMLKAPLHIEQDGTVMQGVWKWRFPGPMKAVVVKLDSKDPRFILELRYGTTHLNFPGGATEGDTIGIAVRLNQWIASKMQGPSISGYSSKKLSEIDWVLYTCIASAVVMFLAGSAWDQNGYYLDQTAPCGLWARIAAGLFSVISLGILAIDLIRKTTSQIRVNCAVWITEIAIALPLILGTSAMVGWVAQYLESSVAPTYEVIFDEQVFFYEPSRGGRFRSKGCQRYLTFHIPDRSGRISYCDPKDIHYWDGISRVRVRLSRGSLGMHIESVDRVVTE
jgi:hypothetical protein